MSYILDALRRAEADREREQGGVPGLHSQPAGPAQHSHPAWRRHAPWLAAAGLILLAGLGASLWLSPRPLPTAAAAPGVDAPTDQPSAVAALTTPPNAAPANPATVAQGQPSAPPLTLVMPPSPATPAATLEPAQALVESKAQTPASALDRIPLAAELPERLRRDLPKLAISGSVYSEERANRFLIVNGEVVHEGARLAPELLLEQIGPRELVLNFRGQRYRQNL